MVFNRRGLVIQRWQKWVRRRSKRLWALGLVILLSIWGYIPLRLAIAFHQAPMPQSMLVLGGGPDREFFAAQFAQNYPNLDIWVSSGSPTAEVQTLFRQADIADTRVHLDRRATDTVTNFTTLVADFKQHRFQHVYVITSDFHMPRAMAIATLVFGSQGIAVTPIAIASSPSRPETWERTLRDCGRSLLWIITGRTGSSLNDR